MIGDRKLIVCAALSVVAHVAFARGLRRLPRRADGPAVRVVSLRVVSPPPAPEPEPEPAKPPEPKPEPKQVVHERARARRASEAEPTTPPRDVPPPEHPPTTADTTDTPVFGISMESTSQAGTGPAMRVGNTARPRAAHDADGTAAEKQLAEPVPSYQVSKQAEPLDRCVGEYTEEAKRAGIEGVVVLSLVVGTDGRTRDIHVVSGHPALTQAAIAALKRCRFSPGEKDGTPVPQSIREFKIRFLLDNAGE